MSLKLTHSHSQKDKAFTASEGVEVRKFIQEERHRQQGCWGQTTEPNFRLAFSYRKG